MQWKAKAGGALCGDYTATGTEICDGADDTSCVGICDAACVCAP